MGTINFIKYEQFINDVRIFIEKLPKFKYVSYIPRSGIIPAFMYSKKFNVPLIDLKEVQNEEDTLIFDDSVHFGRRLNEVQKGLSKPSYACIYYSGEIGLDYKLNFKYKLLPLPRLFEWNWISQREVIERSCFDIDGVLCERMDLLNKDITYENHLKNTKPKYIPNFTIGCICTARTEEDRELTEEWLKKHNVKYNKLIMLKCSKEERRKYGLHSIEKINEYKNPKYILFIEDEIEQAKLISKETNKSVLCVDNWNIY